MADDGCLLELFHACMPDQQCVAAFWWIPRRGYLEGDASHFRWTRANRYSPCDSHVAIMKRRSRIGSVKSRRRKAATPKRGNAPNATRNRGASVSGEEPVVARLARERDEALLRETANSEILRLISRSPGDLERVFRTILEDATRICNANFGTLFRFDGENFNPAAQFNTPAAFLEALTRRGPFRPAPGNPLDHVMRTKQVAHSADMATEPVPGLATKLAGARTQVIVPMLKDDVLIGAILIYRQEVRPFADKQIELVKNFAAQAVIAIENARLLNELRESLGRQTATADLLRIISSSLGDLEPVFAAILDKALHLCEAAFGFVTTYDGERIERVAQRGVPDALAAYFRKGMDQHRPGDAHWRLVAGEDLIHNLDQMDEDAYRLGNPLRRAIVDLGGARSALVVALRKDKVLLGALTVYRKEVRPFTAQQVSLVQSFAAQAVIAIENARLLNELRESLQQQTATADVLRIISSSPGELAPVFLAILQNAIRICEAKFGHMVLADGNLFRLAAEADTPAELVEHFKQRGSFEPTPGSHLDRIRRTKQVSHTADDAAEAVQGRAARYGGARSIVAVPMLKDDVLIGVILIYRQEVRPFTDKQIELVKNFAAQAVIAIENARLLNELRESLEQQTATADVLRIISAVPGELEPVFQSIMENATRICAAKFGTLWLAEEDALRAVAVHNPPPGFAEMRRGSLIRPNPKIAVGRVLISKQVEQVVDLAADAAYIEGDPLRVALVEVAGARTLVVVPMLKDNTLMGAISIYRQEAQAFTDKQIALLQNFAAQAVIAVENSRLLNELRERTHELEVRSQEIAKLNAQLEQRVADQVGEIERMGRLRRFLPPQVADLIVASGAERQLESHRREITALFCDLRGFTGFSESSDPEDVMTLLRQYHAAIGEIIIKYSGTLERYAGDGIMVVFNDPVPVENPALQAVRMALDMRAALGALIEKWRRLGHELGFGIGIAHGYATLGTIGFEGRFDYAAIGTVSNIASRLCDEAKPGQILISPRVLIAVEDAIAVEPIGDFALKGISRPLTAYNVVAAR